MDSRTAAWQAALAQGTRLAQRRTDLAALRTASRRSRDQALAQAVQAQTRLDVGEQVRDVLAGLQRRVTERAVGAYEQLLSAFLGDVLPGERDVVLDLHAERGAPALDVFVRKGTNAPLEDWLGMGGSVTNLLSTGLRLVALMRSGRRRFLVLDESDCWLKPDLIPGYAAVVAQTAEELGVQVLMISHHDESLFATYIAHRLRLSRVGKVLTADWSPGSDVPSWDETQDGIRSISLFDFQSHQRTVIPLAPGVTLLQGDNDIGKSAVVNALRAVFNGDSNDTVIRHHAPTARIEIDFGTKLLSWTRHRKGKVKISHALTDAATGQTLHATDGTKPPAWLMELGIAPVDQLDIQIGQQQDPVFLLNQPGSSRAKALSVGQESGYVGAMMALDRTETTAAKATLKHCEQEIERLRHEIDVLDRLGDANEALNAPAAQRDRQNRLADARQLLAQWQDRQAHTCARAPLSQAAPTTPTPLRGARARALLDTWQASTRQHAVVLSVATAAAPQAPTIRATAARQLRERWAPQHRVHQVLGPLDGRAAPVAPAPRVTPALLGLQDRWVQQQRRMTVLMPLTDGPTPLVPRLTVRAPLVALVRAWVDGSQQVITGQAQLDEDTQALAQAETTLRQTYPECPTCGQAWQGSTVK